MRFERSRGEALSLESAGADSSQKFSDAHNSGGTCALQQSFRLVSSAVAVRMRPSQVIHGLHF